MRLYRFFFFFFFNDTATTEIYTLSLHDALPIYQQPDAEGEQQPGLQRPAHRPVDQDRKSTRLNSSHLVISYAVFCLKKKKKKHIRIHHQTQDNHSPCEHANPTHHRYLSLPCVSD